ncbi:hypothetical protein MPTK1_7g02850 [Marchantia polymorpha subsp. ruderalis]|uniref:Uncharacterized protein n=2 Tax=Marchantia polymorpha TaxID=3197 RepID=A0AAF6BVI4_MARPO|nr:hypothetical protein MARPO_0088s0002 [Marchantia polymorpha]BBN16018.1 hypothetical protein Mp_7g02850 [Marchantia polymorpha subsp. ruderalis]|eukprot:PTQ33452.1 hypothetical protein MARPO_0088s0002 [Marchantia polymorpha]
MADNELSSDYWMHTIYSNLSVSAASAESNFRRVGLKRLGAKRRWREMGVSEKTIDEKGREDILTERTGRRRNNAANLRLRLNVVHPR